MLMAVDIEQKNFSAFYFSLPACRKGTIPLSLIPQLGLLPPEKVAEPVAGVTTER
jgi:hypothetical protein